MLTCAHIGIGGVGDAALGSGEGALGQEDDLGWEDFCSSGPFVSMMSMISATTKRFLTFEAICYAFRWLRHAAWDAS